jgi:hypothetical protein
MTGFADVPFSQIAGKPTTLAGYGISDAQPLDSDLTAIASLATTSFGRGVLTQATGADARTYIGAGTSNFDGDFSSLSGKPTTLAGYGVTDVLVGSSNTIGWSDVLLSRDAANVMAQRNGTTSQLMRVYGTHTDASNYRRLKIGATNNTGTFEVRAEGAGTGANGNKIDVICGSTGVVQSGSFGVWNSQTSTYLSLTSSNGRLRLNGKYVAGWEYTAAMTGDAVGFSSIDSEGVDDGNGNFTYKPTLDVLFDNTTGILLEVTPDQGSPETILGYNINSEAWTVGKVASFRDALGVGTGSIVSFNQLSLYDPTNDSYRTISTDAGQLFFDGIGVQPVITSGTSAPTGGNDGDIFLQYS